MIVAAAFVAGSIVTYAFLRLRLRRMRDASEHLESRLTRHGKSPVEPASHGGTADLVASDAASMIAQGGSKLEAAKVEVLALLDAKLSRMVELEDEMLERESITGEMFPQNISRAKPLYSRARYREPYENCDTKGENLNHQADPSKQECMAEAVNANMNAMSTRIEALQVSIDALQDTTGRLETTQSRLIDVLREFDMRNSGGLSNTACMGHSTQLNSMISPPVDGKKDINRSVVRQARESGIQLVSGIRSNLKETIDTFLRRG